MHSSFASELSLPVDPDKTKIKCMTHFKDESSPQRTSGFILGVQNRKKHIVIKAYKNTGPSHSSKMNCIDGENITIFIIRVRGRIEQRTELVRSKGITLFIRVRERRATQQLFSSEDDFISFSGTSVMSVATFQFQTKLVHLW